MDIAPLLAASVAIQLHVGAALVALALTPVILLRRKGDRLHKLTVRVWTLVMALTALSSFAVHEIRLFGPFSPIHFLSLLTLYSLFGAIYQVRRGRITAHKKHMQGAMVGLVGAGLVTLLPGRLMSDVMFKGVEVPGFAVSLGLSIVALILWRWMGRAGGGSTPA